MELELREEKILRMREEELVELEILKERQRVKDGILRSKIYQPDTFVYDVARMKQNENVMLEHEIVGICQFYKQQNLSRCPIYGYRRYKEEYRYNGLPKSMNGKKNWLA